MLIRMLMNSRHVFMILGMVLFGLICFDELYYKIGPLNIAYGSACKTKNCGRQFGLEKNEKIIGERLFTHLKVFAANKAEKPLTNLTDNRVIY